MSSISRRHFVKTTTFAGMGLLLGCSLRNRFDVVLLNGMVLDGTGSPAQRLDVGIVGDKITALGDLQNATANRVIDATNYIISPGFIDIHTHTDSELLVNPKAESKIRQGVTTEISGNCGSSPFPLTKNDRKAMEENLREKYGLTISWDDINGFLSEIEKAQPSMNYATFTGHGDLRAFAVGKNDVPATPEQLQLMQRRLQESMEHGSIGLSTGLEYAPGSYADTAELISLNEIVAKNHGVYSTHMRNEDDRLDEAVEEALTVARETGVSLQISHLKACNQNNWHKIERVLDTVNTAAESLPVHADRYPYTAYGTGLTAFLPLWSRQGDTDEVLQRLQNTSDIPKIREYTNGRGQRIGGWDRVVISDCRSDQNKQYEGQSIAAAAEQNSVAPFEFIRTLLIQERNRVSIVGFAMDEDNLKKVLADPLVMIGSDGNAVAPYGKLSEGKPHPRYYGTFPRVLGKYSRDENVMLLADAVKKMTSMSAEKLGLRKRGTLKVGNYADIVVFNPKTVIDNATYTNPHQYPTGIDYVLVNGKITIANGEHTGAQAGEVLRDFRA